MAFMRVLKSRIHVLAWVVRHCRLSDIVNTSMFHRGNRVPNS